MSKTIHDLSNQKFGKLVVKYRGDDYVSPRGIHMIRWWCLCECQQELDEDKQTLVLVTSNALKRGNTKSCGCIHKEQLIENNKKLKKKYNTYDLTGEYGIGYTTKGEEFYFDLEDYDKIKKHCWFIGSMGSVTTNKNNNIILMHRLVMDVLNDSQIEVDHIRHIRHDNRKSQLRLVNDSKNAMNRITPKCNTSGYKGVSFDKNLQKYRSYITVNKTHIDLGSFIKLEDAIVARKKADELYFKEYSYQNSIKHNQ